MIYTIMSQIENQHYVRDILLWFALVYTSIVVGCFYLYRKNPKALFNRLKFKGTNHPQSDTSSTIILLVTIMFCLLIGPLDRMIFQCSASPGAMLKLLGLLMILIGMTLNFRTLAENQFAAPTVQFQEGASHTLINTGPYKLVRHPMYIGSLVLIFGSMIWLGSYLSIFAGGLCALAAYSNRIKVEENFLLKVLPDYAVYMESVPRKLIPGIVRVCDLSRRY